ncbi:location of vulva defective 1-like [Saccostrea cucullata]|uniref:location of vulva defective 1-like n=1 Tax=Saccostrea cuccullata TaxID=36930 RepID=UPI002ED555DE
MTTTVISSNHTETTLETGSTGYIPDSTSSSDKITTTSEGTVVEATTIMTTSSEVELSSVTTSTSEPSSTAAVITAYQNNTEEYLNSTLSTGLYTTEYNNVDNFSTQTTLEEETILVGFCVCKCTGSGYKWTEEELADRILQRKIETQLIKKNLTAYYRSLTSANDQRMSSQCIGYIGSVILICFLCLLIFCDFRRFLYYCIIERHAEKHVS